MPIGFLYIIHPFKRRMNLRLTWGCALLLVAATNAQQARAGLITVPPTFAQFHQATPTNADTNLFEYLDNGSANDAQLVSDHNGTVGGAIPVIFSFLSVTGSLPAALSGSQNATLTLTSSTTSPVQTAFTPVIGDQQIYQTGTLSDILTITRSTPFNGHSLLLRMTFTGQLLGAIGGAPQLSGDNTIGSPLYTVTFTSDFLTFPGSSRQFSLTFSSWSGGLQLSTQSNDSIHKYFESATANGTGTFASNATVVPEPSSWILGMIGSSVLFAGYLRKRRARLVKT
ncbi:MAG TPA: PEP-CTERM sorting domain-containing protein [Pirellulales bacterium]|jgi:hypothetical protein|nr:PEP-CTERM sorting domain-containing protein [Pirellulales bacterium]